MPEKMPAINIDKLIEDYPPFGDIADLALHHDELHPYHRICSYLGQLTYDIITAKPETPVTAETERTTVNPLVE